MCAEERQREIGRIARADGRVDVTALAARDPVLADLDLLITDAGLDAELATEVEATGARVVRA